MNREKRKFVVDLKRWELPLVNALQERLIDEIARKKITVTLDEEVLGGALYMVVVATSLLMSNAPYGLRGKKQPIAPGGEVRQ